ncbi:MFS transporter [Cellulomonas hominis]
MTTHAADEAALPIRLRRDRFTFTLYGYFIMWGWLLYSFNPSVPLLARELHVSNAVAGLHGTAMAVGAVIAAALTPRLVRRLGRRTSMVLAGGLVAVGAVVLVTGWTLAATLSAVVLLAVGGNIAISAAQAGLAIHHGIASSAAMTEANGAGSGVGLLGPLAVGVTVGLGWGWRPAVAVTAVLAVVVSALTHRLPTEGALARVTRAPRQNRRRGVPALVPPAPTAPATAPAIAPAAAPITLTPDAPLAQTTPPDDVRRRPSRAAWWFLTAIVAAIALENATTYWATDLVIDRTGAGADIATAATAGLVAGMTIVRFVVGPLSLRVPPYRLLAGAFLLAIVGWAVLWTATVPSVALAGLFIAGLGYGAHYPLSVWLLLDVSVGATDRAQARATLAGGAAIGVAPFLLGALADQVGAHTAFLVVPVVAVVGAVAAVAGARAARE